MVTIASLAAKVSVEGAAAAKAQLTAFENQLKSASKGVGSLGASGAGLGGLSGGLNAGSVATAGLSAAAGVAKVAMIGLAAAAAAVGAGLVITVKSAAEFEKIMSGVKAVSGATAADMNQLSALAMQLGKDTVFSAAQAGTALEELVKGGISIADIMNGAAKATVNLAIAGGVDLASAAEIAANALNMFGLQGRDMAHVADQVAGAANASSLSVQDFRLSLQMTGAVANLTGQSFDSTATAIALMGQAGIKGSDAGTSLKQMLITLQPTTRTAKDMFNQLGITVNDTGNKFIDASGKYKSMRDISEVLRTSLAGYTQAEKEMALQVMFGTDAIRAGAILAAGGAPAYDAMAASMSKVTAESVGLERMNNLAGDFENLKGTVETLAIKFGESLTPSLRTVTQAATAFLNDVIDIMPGLIDIAGESLNTMASEANTLANKALYALYIAGETVGVMWDELSAKAAPIVGIVNSIAGAASSATYWFNSSAAAIHNFLAELGMAPKGVYDPVGSWLGGQLSDNQIGDPLNIARNKAAAKDATAAASWGRPDDSAYGGGGAFAPKPLNAFEQALKTAADYFAGIQADAASRTDAINSRAKVAARGDAQDAMTRKNAAMDVGDVGMAPLAAPAPVCAPLVTGGGGGGSGGGGGGGGGDGGAAARTAADTAETQATKALQDAISKLNDERTRQKTILSDLQSVQLKGMGAIDEQSRAYNRQAQQLRLQQLALYAGGTNKAGNLRGSAKKQYDALQRQMDVISRQGEAASIRKSLAYDEPLRQIALAAQGGPAKEMNPAEALKAAKDAWLQYQTLTVSMDKLELTLKALTTAYTNSKVNLDAKAFGGAVSAGKPYLVGERGPEPFIPTTNGVILPNSFLRGSNGTSVTVNLGGVVVSGNADIETLANTVADRVRSALDGDVSAMIRQRPRRELGFSVG